ncbi:tyrosine-type recombinase/integrase [Schleiferiaceae bacterium]|nr:tyrosine-type recombinase/integrase [Schleiferiaceae bacterium]
MKKNWSVTVGSAQGKPFINVYFQKKRFRYWNGKVINVNLKAEEDSELLRSAFELKLREGWKPEVRVVSKKKAVEVPKTFLRLLQEQLDKKQDGHFSFHYKRDCKWLFNQWLKYSKEKGLHSYYPERLTSHIIEDFVKQSRWSARTQKNVLTYFKILTKDILNIQLGGIKLSRIKSELHKPIRNPNALLEDIKSYDKRLYLTCILTYGCLLRPHQEIRLLKWGDIDFERRIISLSGKRNKSGRNRVVPMSQFIVESLSSFSENKLNNNYVLSSSDSPYNRDYISLLWSRYRKQSQLLEKGVTLYSWRHHGAIKVFEKTGSLIKLQQVMGHSDMKVSLTYLRGLEVKQLDVEDLPKL